MLCLQIKFGLLHIVTKLEFLQVLTNSKSIKCIYFILGIYSTIDLVFKAL